MTANTQYIHYYLKNTIGKTIQVSDFTREPRYFLGSAQDGHILTEWLQSRDQSFSILFITRNIDQEIIMATVLLKQNFIETKLETGQKTALLRETKTPAPWVNRTWIEANKRHTVRDGRDSI